MVVVLPRPGSYVGGDAIDRIFQAVLEIETMSYLPSLDSRDLLVGFILAAITSVALN